MSMKNISYIKPELTTDGKIENLVNESIRGWKGINIGSFYDNNLNEFCEPLTNKIQQSTHTLKQRDMYSKKPFDNTMTMFWYDWTSYNSERSLPKFTSWLLGLGPLQDFNMFHSGEMIIRSL